MRSRTRVWALAIMTIGFASPAHAGLTISIGSASVAPGGTAMVDVLISASSAESINFYGFQLQMTNNGSDNTQLAFSNTQDFSYISNAGLNPSYVFLNDSSAAQPPVSPIGAAFTTVYLNDSFSGTDSTNSGNPVSIAAGQTYLLAILSITTATEAPPLLGDSFTIGLVPGSGDGSVNTNSQTFFGNFNFNTGVEISAAPFTSTSGTVNIVGAAVPEPSSIVMGLAGLVLPVGMIVIKRRRVARTIRA
jgi:hypothetical protein